MKYINQFCGYFERQLAVITILSANIDPLSNVTSEDCQLQLYRKALLVMMVDALAGIRFPKKRFPELNRRNQERFTRFVLEVAQWKAGKLVSIPFLMKRLKEGKGQHSSFSDYVKKRFSLFSAESNIVAARDVDLPSCDLFDYASTEVEEKMISEFQHCSLLYRYRNHLIHEARTPGGAMDFGLPEGEPYYHGLIGSDDWYLVYPVQTFQVLVSDSIKGMREYLSENSINPYDFVDTKTLW